MDSNSKNTQSIFFSLPITNVFLFLSISNKIYFFSISFFEFLVLSKCTPPNLLHIYVITSLLLILIFSKYIQVESKNLDNLYFSNSLSKLHFVSIVTIALQNPIPLYIPPPA